MLWTDSYVYLLLLVYFYFAATLVLIFLGHGVSSSDISLIAKGGIEILHGAWWTSQSW